ncbi:methylthioribose-1-phosphate isomerase [Roseibium hamelinense]|uniref:Methylthioribose-1-phosphate isomerase n=1 Tax=Roseibium hamelinense TaxID=150831 RepID=A0A562SXL7_9HYPH|nr:S-methyl-5-thioribose-1-phosphate isomerase [Roseibium hamelinense]MTI43581.1 S-methyl-5-thioribose-1-phosphate isomerase [Roseibium hamelinense]TWI86095.1 methylthioribose-1-phosphate isomerase [Roseibium hamelinense]
MKVNGEKYRTIWPAEDGSGVVIIDQTKFPHTFETTSLLDLEDAAHAIRVMQVRGAPLIGATAAFGVALGMKADPSDESLHAACDTLLATRPTAVNLKWALDIARKRLIQIAPERRAHAAFELASQICDDDIATNMAIGMHGMELITEIAKKKRPGEPVNVLTHCNAGWLATVDWGTATAPIYMSHDSGIPVHVWVDETRPRNQGAFLTAWELGHHGVPHTVVVDNAGGHLMQHGKVDLVITGTDRTTADGDVCNKIGTYLKALAARDNGVPFYVALPSSTIDFSLSDGLSQIPIEERSGTEVSHITGLTEDGRTETVEIVAPGSDTANPAFDVTPARLVTGLITERGVLEANRKAIVKAFPERMKMSA